MAASPEPVDGAASARRMCAECEALCAVVEGLELTDEEAAEELCRAALARVADLRRRLGGPLRHAAADLPPEAAEHVARARAALARAGRALEQRGADVRALMASVRERMAELRRGAHALRRYRQA